MAKNKKKTDIRVGDWVRIRLRGPSWNYLTGQVMSICGQTATVKVANRKQLETFLLSDLKIWKSRMAVAGQRRSNE
jgi:hypothetical protein